MAERFNLILVTPTGVVFDGPVDEVSAAGALGEFGVLAMHTDYITALNPGMLSIRRSGGGRDNYLVSGGLCEVRENKMTVLAQELEDAGTQDAAQAAKDAAAAEQQLGKLSSYEPEFAEVEHTMLLARARERAAAFARTRD